MSFLFVHRGERHNYCKKKYRMSSSRENEPQEKKKCAPLGYHLYRGVRPRSGPSRPVRFVLSCFVLRRRTGQGKQQSLSSPHFNVFPCNAPRVDLTQRRSFAIQRWPTCRSVPAVTTARATLNPPSSDRRAIPWSWWIFFRAKTFLAG